MVKRRQVAVIGLGRFGTAVATTLFQIGHDVLAVDLDARLVQAISEQVTHAVQADASDAAVLRDLGVHHFDAGIVGVSADLERSILVTVQLKHVGVPLVIAKAQTVLHGQILEKVGADRVVFPEREVGEHIAHSFAVPNVLEYMPIGMEFGISKLAPPSEFVGRTVGELRLAERCGVTLLLIERRTHALLNPAPDDVIQPGDLLVVAAPDEAMEQLR